VRFPRITLKLPEWVEERFAEGDLLCPTLKDRMQLVIDLARENVRRGTGGPFGAAIFELETGRLVAPGVNLVEGHNLSAAHAEMVAISMAQWAMGRFDLSGGPPCELVTSTEPCAMCFGGVIWSGVKSLVCGAREEDARSIGFDEGPKVKDWVGELSARGVEVRRDVCRREAAEVLKEYLRKGGAIYNARQGDHKK
jgi:tRNA(Arg) A34 adenosine deaminase TadA